MIYLLCNAPIQRIKKISISSLWHLKEIYIFFWMQNLQKVKINLFILFLSSQILISLIQNKQQPMRNIFAIALMKHFPCWLETLPYKESSTKTKVLKNIITPTKHHQKSHLWWLFCLRRKSAHWYQIRPKI